jgi:hypothetical protein|tara:strand:- start:48 stop:530 length:483 start_codon:yes stop_codon:yes gene_type:complete
VPEVIGSEVMTVVIANQLSTVTAKTVLDLTTLIQTMKTNGISNAIIKETLMADLAEGGRLFGGFKNQIKNTVKSGIGRASNAATLNTFSEAGIKEFKWQTIGGDNVCPDCDERADEINSIEYWKTVGIPKSGFSVCQDNCLCELLPASYKGENLSGKLVR